MMGSMNDDRNAQLRMPSATVNEIKMPNPRIFAFVGEDGVRRMIRDFYFELAKSPIAPMFPSDESLLIESADKSALFWITILGGPPLYREKHGDPRMRARHMPFKIDQSARDHWYACWLPILAIAPQKYGFPEEDMEGLRRYIQDFSAWMINSQ